MPRLPQCAFKEGRRRCMRGATGQSPFCRAHELVARSAATGAGSKFVASAFDLLDDVLSGRGVSREKVASAINDGIAEMGGDPTGFFPPTGFRPPPGWRPRPPAKRPQAQPPPPPPPTDNLAEIAAARRELGFGPRDHLTADLLRRRHRELAKRHHPDRGGSVARMQAINAAVDILGSTI